MFENLKLPGVIAIGTKSSSKKDSKKEEPIEDGMEETETTEYDGENTFEDVDTAFTALEDAVESEDLDAIEAALAELQEVYAILKEEYEQ